MALGSKNSLKENEYNSLKSSLSKGFSFFIYGKKTLCLGFVSLNLVCANSLRTFWAAMSVPSLTEIKFQIASVSVFQSTKWRTIVLLLLVKTPDSGK